MGVLLRLIVVVFIAFAAKSCQHIKKNVKEISKNETLLQTKKMPQWLRLNVEESLPRTGLNIWVPTNNFSTSSLVKVPRFPRKIKQEELEKKPALQKFVIVPLQDSTVLRLNGVRNEQVSAQLAVASNTNISGLRVAVSNLRTVDGELFDSKNIIIRNVNYLPVERARSEYVWSPKLEEIAGEAVSGSMNPNVVADALMESDSVNVPAYHAQPFWFTVTIPKDIAPAVYSGEIVISSTEEGTKRYPIEITVQEPVLPDCKDYAFHLDLWINPSSISHVYGIVPWSEEHWKLIGIYLKDYAKVGGKNITTIITHEPWHKPWLNDITRSQTQFGYQSMINWIKTKDGNWKFDFTVFDRYVMLAESLGIKGAINAFSLTPFHTKQTLHYFDEKEDRQKIIEVDVTDKEYKEIWTGFLKAFKTHLVKKEWYSKTYLGFDEKPQNVFRIIKEIIQTVTPEFLDRIVIAGHPETTSLAENLSVSYMFFPKMPFEKKATIPVLSTIEARRKEGKTTTFYLCAEPAHPNTLTYSPAIESQMIPWLALKYNTDGYLRWAYNNWTEDTFNLPVFLHNQGDDYYVYPGENGPISSIRWELLKEGIEDYELFRTIAEKYKVPVDSLKKAIEIATRNQDGRYKSVGDFVVSRSIILNHLKK